MGELMNLAVYNPAILSDDDFLMGFVARQNVAENLLGQLREITATNLARHQLILGQRGMGKTSLLRRIRLGVRDDPELASVLLPLSFREEQYNVHDLHSFWCNCLDALANRLELDGQADQADALDQETAKLARDKTDPEGTAARELFETWMKQQGRRALLLLDNIDLILNGLGKQDWSLRRILQQAGGIVVMGATASYLESTESPEAAFYDFFHVTVLERLSAQELPICLNRLAEARGTEGDKVKQLVARDPARIRTLHDLTGGNPRTLVLLYLLLELDSGGDVFSDLERLLDQVTPLYKARIEDLAPQPRVVLDALALHWNPATAAQLAETTGLATQAVSAQLDRLLKTGLLEKVPVSTSKRTAFQLGERFFNIWYLMRHGPRRQRTRLRWLTGFLRGFYTPAQLRERGKTVLQQTTNASSHHDYVLALCDAIDDSGLRNLLAAEARRLMENFAHANGKRLEDLTDPDELPSPKTAQDWHAMGWWLQTELNKFEEAERAYRCALDLEPRSVTTWANLGTLLMDSLNRHKDAETTYRHAIELAPEFAGLWTGLGLLLTGSLNCPEEAEQAFRRAIELDPKETRAWSGLGHLLAERLNRPEEAEQAFRRAIELAPEYYNPWLGLGGLLMEHLDRPKEAEQALRQTIKLAPNNIIAWYSLGELLAERLNRIDDAEKAIRHAIKLDPNNAIPWTYLGNLQKNHLNLPNEAEQAYLQAIEKDPTDARPWHNMGNLLHADLKRPAEAEKAYREAIQLSPDQASPWNNLGILLMDYLNRPEEAEEAFRYAIKLSPNSALHWNNLALVLKIYLIRPKEAEQAFKQSIQLDPQDTSTWDGLGSLLADLLDRPEEAEQAYRRAMELDPSNSTSQANLAFLLLRQKDRQTEAENLARRLLPILPMTGAGLLRTYLALAKNDLGEASTAFEKVLKSNDPTLLTTYEEDVLRVLRLATEKNNGEYLLNWMDERGIDDRHWPLRSAFDAYLNGEERLLDVNPEVRSAAQRLFEWLNRIPVQSD